MTKPHLLAVFRSRRMAVLCALGFASGLPYLLVGQTLQAWLSSQHVELGRIARMSLVGLAYNLKFLWAPLLDRFALPMLGRRRGWMLALQLALVAAICVMGALDPAAQPAALATCAVVVAFLSASQDIVLDAYNAEILDVHERAAGSAIYVFGYRVALLVTGTLALVLADHVAWRAVYMIMACLLSVGVAATLLAAEPARPARTPATLRDAIALPVIELVRSHGRRGAVLVLAFAATYELGYFFAQSVMIPFLERGAGFELTEIAAVNKTFVFVGTAIGGLAAGALVARFGLRWMLLAFGALAAVTHLLYAALAVAGHSFPMFCTAVLVDSVANAMVISAFVAVLMAACSPAVTATQLALLTSLASLIGQRVLGPCAGDVVAAIGWAGLFVATAVATLPGLALAWYVGRRFAGGSGVREP